MVSPGYMKLKVDTQSPGWHKTLTKVLKSVTGLSYSIDTQKGVAHVYGKIDPKKFLKKLEKAGRKAELMEAHSDDLYGNNDVMYGHDYDGYYDEYSPYSYAYGRPMDPLSQYPHHTYSQPRYYQPASYYEPRYCSYYEPPAQYFPQPPSPLKVHPFYDPHYSCSLM